MTDEQLKKEVDQIMSIKGGVKGTEIRAIGQYIKKRHGEEGLWLIEKKMKDIGYSFYFNKIETSSWYLEALYTSVGFVAQEVFGWKDLYDYGYNSPVFSFGLKMFIKFASVKSVFESAPRYWNRFLDVGELESYELNEKKKYIILRIKNFKFHSSTCRFFAGLFLRIVEFTINRKGTVKETKCRFRGDPYDEFLISWK